MRAYLRQSVYLLLAASLLLSLVSCSNSDSPSRLLVAFVLDGASMPPGSIQSYDAGTGAPNGAFVSGGGLVEPVAIVFGPDGNLYVTDINTGNILRYNGTTGAFISTVGTLMAGADPMFGFSIGPLGMAFSPAGDLYVINDLTNDVTRFNVTTDTVVSTFGGSELQLPIDGTFGPDGNLYVGSFNGNTIERYDAAGTYLGTFATIAGLGGPEQIAFGSDGNLYTANFNSSSVDRFNGTTGAFIDTFVPTGSGGLDSSTGLAFAPSGVLYVSSNATGEIMRYNGVTGAFLNTVVPASSVGVFPAFLAFQP